MYYHGLGNEGVVELCIIPRNAKSNSYTIYIRQINSGNPIMINVPPQKPRQTNANNYSTIIHGHSVDMEAEAEFR